MLILDTWLQIPTKQASPATSAIPLRWVGGSWRIKFLLDRAGCKVPQCLCVCVCGVGDKDPTRLGRTKVVGANRRGGAERVMTAILMGLVSKSVCSKRLGRLAVVLG